jgi:hypothetical protein
MDKPFTVQGAVLEVLQNLGHGAVEYAPRLISAVVLVIIGFIISRIAEVIVGQVLYRAQLDTVLERTGLSSGLERVGIRDVSRRFLPRILFWLAMLVFLQSAATMAGMVTIAAGINSLFVFLPNLFTAAMILLVGNALAQFLARAVTAYARESGIGFARSLGSAISAFVVGVVVIIALGQLQVDTRILNILTIVIFSGLSLGFALTFGLGTRDTTRNLIAGFYARRLFGAGQRLEIAGTSGVLRSISATQTVLDAEGRSFALPNSVFLEQVVGRIEEPAPPA